MQKYQACNICLIWVVGLGEVFLYKRLATASFFCEHILEDLVSAKRPPMLDLVER